MRMQKMQNLMFSLLIVGLVLMTSCNNEEEVIPTTITANDFSASIDENPTNGDVIGMVEATVNQSNITAYEISSQSVDGAITLNSTTGEITVADATAFDYETNQSITGKIKIITEDAIEKEVSFILTINNLAEPDIHITVSRGTSNQDILSGDTFDFGLVGGNIGKSFRIHNLGDADLVLTGSPLVKVLGDDYSIFTQPDSNTIPAGGFVAISINFNPTSFGTSTGTVEIANNDTDESLYIINLTGEEAL